MSELHFENEDANLCWSEDSEWHTSCDNDLASGENNELDSSANISCNGETDEEEEDKTATLFIRLIKPFSMMILVFSLLIFVGIAWFTMNSDVSSGGMGVKTAALPFELRTSGSVGLYDNYITTVDSGYSTGSETGGNNGQKIIWQLTSQSQMENLWNGDGTPTSEDMRRIQKLESDAYGLSPGDYGQMTFTIVPKTTTGFTAKIKPQVTCFKTTYDSDGYQSETITEMDEDDDDDLEAMNYLSGHIRFYYKYDSDDDGTDEMHLITDTFTVENIVADTDVTLYWVWPNRLNNILELNVEGLDSTANVELRKYFFTNPSIFLAKTSSDSATVFDGITLGSDATDEQINAAVSSMTSPASTYSSWSGRYNSADQIIGDRVGYIMLEVQVEPDGTN
ncbi:MAG: hypothetical protein IJH82_09680 [Lachnospiraceae bacterium]|nr:hypothetical protein [Lachnospiraceae bacterium]